MKKRMIAACAALTLLLGALAGCSKDKTTPDGADPSAQTGTTPEASSQYAYQAQYLDIPEQVRWVSTSCVSGDMLFFAGGVSDGGKASYIDDSGNESFYDTYTEAVFRLDPDSGECVQLENYVSKPDVEALCGAADPADYTVNTSIQNMAAGADGTIWIYRQTDCYSEDGTDGGTLSELVQLDASGTQLRTITPAAPQNETVYASLDSIFSDDQGYVYTYDYQNVNVYGPDGSLIFSKSRDDGFVQLCQLSPSEVGLMSISAEGKTVFKLFDTASKSFGKETPVSDNARMLYAGNDIYRYFYTNGSDLFGERRDSGEVEKVVDWLACDIDSGKISTDRLGFFSDGRIAAVSHDFSENGAGQQIVVLRRVDASEVPQKTELTLACFWLDYDLRSQIVRFNKTNADYRIVVKDYAEYSSDGDPNAGLTKLNTEIISGNAPDLIANDMTMPLRQYAAKGLLEDLWPYIDKDPVYSRDALMTQPLEATQTDGKLYQLPLSFGVTTAIGIGKIVGGYETWTLADVNDALGKLSEGATVFSPEYTQSQMLLYCVAMNAKNFIDWQNGTCDFDSDAFRALLEFIKPLPAEFDWQSSEEYESDFSRMKNGRQLLSPTTIAGYDDLYYTFAVLDGDVRFIGFPREDGSSGNAFAFGTTLSITTTCKDKDAAWAFIRTTLSEEAQKEAWRFPILKSVFDAKAKEAMTQEYLTDDDGKQVLDENGEPIPISTGGMSYGNEPMIELYAVTQEQFDAVMALIDSTTSYIDFDQNVINIITEEAAGYFSGGKSVEEASKHIQSRVSLYIQEQK